MKVIFLKDGEGDVFALFPDSRYLHTTHPLYNRIMVCYSQEEQHSSCDLLHAINCEPAEPKEYDDLYNELVSIGYDEIELTGKYYLNELKALC